MTGKQRVTEFVAVAGPVGCFAGRAEHRLSDADATPACRFPPMRSLASAFAPLVGVALAARFGADHEDWKHVGDL